MTGHRLPEGLDPGWAEALEPVAGQIAAMGEFLRAEVAAGRTYLPAGSNILRAFTQPLADVRVLIVGQDPYPTPGHPIGLCFAVDRDVRPIPRSLQNIYRELRSPAKAAELRLHGLKPAGVYTHLILAMKLLLLAAAQKLR